jgi:hypothetical protein
LLLFCGRGSPCRFATVGDFLRRLCVELEGRIDRHNFGAQADHELFARPLGVLACFGGDRFHQGVELLVGGFVGDVVQVEGL